jgi:hypothetical protein
MMFVPTTSNAKAVVILASIFAALILAAVCGWWAYGQGYEKAEAKGRAELQELRAGYATAGAESLAKALDRNEKLVAAGNTIAADLITTRRELATARADITRRIPDAAQSASAACVFGPVFVRWWNDAAGLRADALPQAADPGRAADGPGEAGPAGSGVRQDAPVSLQALMTHYRDLAAYCREVENISAARLHLIEEWAR